MGLQDTRGHLRDFGTLKQGASPAPEEEGIHQLQLAHLQPHTSVLARDRAAKGGDGGLCRAVAEEGWWKGPRGGEPRGMVTNQQEATRNTEAAMKITRGNEHFRKEIPL